MIEVKLQSRVALGEKDREVILWNREDRKEAGMVSSQGERPKKMNLCLPLVSLTIGFCP